MREYIGRAKQCYQPVKVCKTLHTALDLFPIKPIIGRNTLNTNESTLRPLPYRHRYCGPYY